MRIISSIVFGGMLFEEIEDAVNKLLPKEINLMQFCNQRQTHNRCLKTFKRRD
jgi:hypothetical protein